MLGPRLTARVRPWPWVATAVLALVLGLWWTPADAAPPVQGPGAAMLADVQALTELGPRPAGSPTAHAAEAMLIARVQALGLSAERFEVGVMELPAIAVADRVLMQPRRVAFADATVLVTLPASVPAAAPGEALLVMAHYDSVPGSPGAIDNAGAVAVGLELLRRLLDAHRPRDVLVAFTAAEEVRLAGAHALAAGLQANARPLPTLCVSLDMVGLATGTLTLNGLSTLVDGAWRRRLTTAAADAAVELDAPLLHQVISRRLPQLERSDHGVFTALGAAAFHLYHRPPGRNYLAYHRPIDTLRYVDVERLVDAADFLTALATDPAAYPAQPDTPSVWLAGVVVPRMVMLALTAALLGVLVAITWRRRGSPRGRRPFGPLRALAILVVAWSVSALVEMGLDAFTGHPAPWVHQPISTTLALLGCATLVAALLAPALARPSETPPGAAPMTEVPPTGALLTGAWLAAAVGVALALADVFELAWLPLSTAACLALLATSLAWPVRVAAALCSVAPVAWLLSGGTIREANYNGFFPGTLPLAAVIAALTLPHAVAALQGAAWLSRRPRAHQRATTAVIATLAILAVLLAGRSPVCSGAVFERRGLACEIPDTP